MMMSPRLMPMRDSMHRSAGTLAFRAVIARCSATAQRSAPHRIDNTGKLDEQSIARRLDDAPVLFADFGVDDLTAQLFQRVVGALLIRSHQARVANHIGGKNCGETTSGGHLRAGAWFSP